MTSRPLLTTIIAVALVAVGCSVTSTPDTTGSGPNSTTSSPFDPTTSQAPLGVAGLELADCEEPPAEAAIVCEAYDLVKTRYVDQIDDDVLADAASLGLQSLDGTNASELIVCAIPSEVFETTCNLAAETADDSTEAAEAMVAGLAAYALDANSGYFDADALNLLEEEQEGHVEGIGALVSPEDETMEGQDNQCSIVSETCHILIVSTIKGAPAEAAGLIPDDAIVGVDGRSLIGWSVDEVTAIVRGPAGTDVTLTIDRGGRLLDVVITRESFTVPVLDYDTFGETGYVRLHTFTGDAGPEFESAVVDLLADGVDRLVVDLRGNPGGFLNAAIDVASVFLADGFVITTEGPNESLEYEVNGRAVVPADLPVTLVVDKGSASASEVVSAVLQERGRATIVGQNTFGKNTVQQRFGLSNGGALKLTIARWVTPGGLDFGGIGVTPDIELEVYGLDPEELVAAVSNLA
ncbi:MAG: S41 family peptidase [Acidimicrobiia bacterium]|jgi:carboxyl-terminal processing protease